MRDIVVSSVEKRIGRKYIGYRRKVSLALLARHFAPSPAWGGPAPATRKMRRNNDGSATP